MFNEEELKILNSITEGFSRRAKHARLQSFEEFMGKLYIFLDGVEKGYMATIDDYTNDVSKRKFAGELLDQLPPTLKKKVNELKCISLCTNTGDVGESPSNTFA